MKKKKQKMERVVVFTYKDTDVNMLYRNGYLGYTFEMDGKTYGNKVKPESKSVADTANAAFLLLLSFIETLEAVKKL